MLQEMTDHLFSGQFFMAPALDQLLKRISGERQGNGLGL
jgi:hypothetical protein